MNKRGLSAIVITLILILLSLVAVGIVWVVISRILSEATGNIGFEQLTLSIEITEAYEYNGSIVANVKRNVGKGEVVKLAFLLYSDGETETYRIDAPIKELEMRRFTIPVTEFVSTDIGEIAVAPIYLSSGEEKLGNILDTYKITESRQIEMIIQEENTTTQQNETIPEEEEHEGGGGGGDEQPQGCVPDSISTTCGISNCGMKVNNCNETIVCGECPFGQICREGICDLPLMVNSGIVEDLWPGGSGMYFGSTSLPVNIGYSGYYAKFPGSAETSCLLIVVYRFPVEGYNKSHIGFSFGTSLQVGDRYEIYESIGGCSQ